MTIRVESLTKEKDLLLLKADTQHNIASAFIRVQEFYESQGPLRRKVFTMEEYMDWYAKENGAFTYLSDWAGFNVPGHIVDQFFKRFKDLRPKEIELLAAIRGARKGKKGKYYIIGVYDSPNVGGYIDHEICHALWYLEAEFQTKAKKLLKEMPKGATKLMDKFIFEECKYHKDEHLDESNAYWSTNPMVQTAIDLDTEKLPWNHILKFQQLFFDAKGNREILQDD